MDAHEVNRIVRQFNVVLRLVDLSGEKTGWSTWIRSPSPSYLELAGGGPMLLTDVESIEIDPVQKQWRGTLLPPLEIDKSQDIRNQLQQARVSFEMVDGLLRLAMR